MSEYRNRRGKPISGLEWQRKFEDVNYRAVSNDLLDNGMQVSTFWVGVGESAGAPARPLFETLVFGGGENDHRKRTYATLADAIRGHRQVVDKLRGGLAESKEESRPAVDTPGRISAKGRVVRQPAVRPWVLAMASQLSERLRSDARLELIAGARLLLEGGVASAECPDPLLPAEPGTASVDLLVRENAQQGWIPRVAIQTLNGSVATREVRACDELAARLRGSQPGLRNGILIRNVGHIPATLIQHGGHFDFIAALDAQSPSAKGHCDLVTVLLDEVQSSRVVGSMISGRQDRRRCTLIHRPMFLPGHQ